MALIADGLLIAACLTTAIYCFVLSRRLRRLSDTGAGIGKRIRELNIALEETRGALGEIRTTAGGASERLARDVAAARRQASQLSRLIARAAERAEPPPARAYAAPPHADSPADPDAAESGTPPDASPGDDDMRDMPVRRTAAGLPGDIGDDAAGDISEQAVCLAEDETQDAPLGELQLGFLPETADLPEDPADLALDIADGEPDPPDSRANRPERDAAQRPDAETPPIRRGPAWPGEEDVLKVERMAL